MLSTGVGLVMYQFLGEQKDRGGDNAGGQPQAEEDLKVLRTGCMGLGVSGPTFREFHGDRHRPGCWLMGPMAQSQVPGGLVQSSSPPPVNTSRSPMQSRSA